MLRNRAWSHVFLRKSLYGALIAAILVSIGCQQQKAETEEKPPVPTVQLSIVIHKTLEGVVRPLISAFQEQLTGSRIVELQITSYAGFDDAQKIASGEAKNDIWFTPTAIMPKWVEAHIRNLGAPQKDCTAYGRTPLRLVGTKNMFNRTCDPEAGCLWEAVTKYFTENVREGKEDEEITFSLVPPPYGPVATLAWANLLQWDGSDMSSTLDEASDTKKTHEWLSLNPVYLPNYEAVFSRMVNAQPNEQQIAVGPEAIYLSHLQNAPLERIENLMVLPLRNRKSLSQDLMLCTSTGDWLTPDKESLVNSFRNFLQSDKGKSIIESKGYLIPGEKADGEMPEFSTLESPAVRDRVTASWNLNKKPAALLLALDTSASLEEAEQILEVKRFVSLLLASEPQTSSISLMTFSDKPHTAVRFGGSRSKIQEKVDRIQPLGGSAVYDAFAAAFDELREAPAGYRKRMIFVTDGGDINSKLLKDQLLLLVQRRTNWRNAEVLIIGLQAEGSKLTEVKEIANAANSRYIEIPATGLTQILKEMVSP